MECWSLDFNSPIFQRSIFFIDTHLKNPKYEDVKFPHVASQSSHPSRRPFWDNYLDFQMMIRAKTGFYND